MLLLKNVCQYKLIFVTLSKMTSKHNISIIGAGAAGCFCAIMLKRLAPDAEITVYERGTRALAKVAVTGGGRCNLTNSFAHFTDDARRYHDLHLVYPRGGKLMQRMLSMFSHEDTMKLFKTEGVKLVVQPDECVFPQSQDAMEIVNTLLSAMRREGVRLETSMKLLSIETNEDEGYRLSFENRDKGKMINVTVSSDCVVIATGGGSAPFLHNLNVKMTDTLPSLFTFNLAGADKKEPARGDAPCQELMGTVVENVEVKLGGTKLCAHGPLLWTHWGMSGPAILKLSSYAAQVLATNDYQGTLIVNWCGEMDGSEVEMMLRNLLERNSGKLIANVWPPFLTQKHWGWLLRFAKVPTTQRCDAVNAKQMSNLLSALTSQQFTITGRCHYKDEFVTCGGVSLGEIDKKTLEHRHLPRLYFAGEALDVDAITGGFNLQAAWSTAACVARAIADSITV